MKRILRQAGLIVGASAACWAQGTASAADRSAAYYNYTLAHLYANLAAESVNGASYVDQAIAAYKAAIAADPKAGVLPEELSDIYIQFNRLPQARTEAEAAIQKNPNDLAAHRILARIYVRLITSGQNQNVDSTMLRRAIEEYQKVTDLDPRDVSSLVFLGRLQRAAQDTAGAAKSFDLALGIDPNNEDALVGRASVYSDLGDVKSAAELFDRAAQANPSAASWQRLAAAYEQLREFELAADAIKKALAAGPDNPDELRKALAQDLFNAGKYDEAAEAYEAAAKDDPKDPRLWLRISELRMQQGDLQKAREAEERALAISPADLAVRYQEVNLLQAEGKPEEAIGKLRSALESQVRVSYSTQQKRERIQLLDRLAMLYRLMNQPVEAVNAYREIIELDSTQDAERSATIIDTLREGKRIEDAQQEARAAKLKFPEDETVRVALAFLDADMGHARDAANDIKKLLTGPNDFRVDLTLAQIYEKGKLWEDAGKALDAAEKLAMDPNDQITVWFMRGALYERMNNLPLAEGQFRQVLGVMPEHPGALNYLGYMLTDRNTRLNEALGLIEKALSKDPYNGAYLDSLGWVYFRLGRFEDAEKQMREAVRLAPGDPTMQDHFADVLMERKKVGEAVKAWEEALREWQASAPAEKDDEAIKRVRGKLDRARQQLGR